MLLSTSSVVNTPVENGNNHHDLTLVVTQAQLGEMGVESKGDVTAVGHCCYCSCAKRHFVVIDPISVGEKTSKQGFLEYADSGDFPFGEATPEFVQKVEGMIAELKS